MLDNKGRLFGKISIVDLLVVIIVAVMLVGSFTAYQKIQNKTVLTEDRALIQNDALDTLEVTMRLEEVRQITLDAIHVGDEVYMKETGKRLGEITAVTSEPATRLIYDLKGQAVNAEVPMRYDVIMKVEVPGNRLENGYYTADNIQLVYDSAMEIVTPTIQTTPNIEIITTKSGE